jgi:hypothetical protein
MTTSNIPIEQIGSNRTLAKELQTALAAAGYLDPPSDGDFANVSLWALAELGRRHGLQPSRGFTPRYHELVLRPENPLPEPRNGPAWLLSVIEHMRHEGHWYSRHPTCWNIVYVEGMAPNGKRTANTPDHFDDTRLVFRVIDGGQLEVHSWDGTTEPGRDPVLNPRNPKGAARIAFGQYKAWGVGMHPQSRKTNQHEALVQRRDIPVHRDLNKDFKRTGDKVDTGMHGINQHWGFDQAANRVGGASAGCLVGRTKQGHREFMALVKADPRFKANSGYLFMTTVLDGAKLAL